MKVKFFMRVSLVQTDTHFFSWWIIEKKFFKSVPVVIIKLNASTFKKQKFAGKGFVECLILEVLIPHEDFAFAFYVFINSFIC